MNLRKAVVVAFAAVCLAVTFPGCGKGSVPITILPLNVTSTSVPTAVINKSYSTTLTATGGLAPFTWSIISGTLPAGLTMSSSGVISGAATTTGSQDFTVQVTDSQTPTHAVATGALTLKVNNPLAISTTSIDIAAVNVPYQFTLSATGGATPYTWSLASGSLPSGMNLDPGFGVIFGTATAQGMFPITIQVADTENPPVTVQQAFTFTVGGPAARLSGKYSFLFRGFVNGKQVLQAGSFVADGNGNVTSGVTDIMSTSSTNTNVAITGTYTVDDTGHGTMSLMFGPNGSIGKGTYQITNSLGGYWAFIQNGDGQSTQYGAGIFEKQGIVPTDLSNSKGNWVFGGYGADSSDNRYAAAGAFNLQPGPSGTGGGTLQTGNVDVNDHGSVTQNTTFTGNINQPDPNTGRGTMSFTAGNIVSQFAFYYIDDGDFIAVETDKVQSSTPLILYTMMKQTTVIPVDNTILNGNGITELTAVASVNGQNVSETSLSDWSFDLKGTVWATFDDNTGGTLSQIKPQGTYSVTKTGRTTFTGLPTGPIMYIATTDRGYILGTDANVTYGEMEQQRPPSASNGSFTSGNDGGSIISPALASQTVEVDTFTADGKGTLTGNYDTSGPNGPMMGLAINATYTVESASCDSTGTTFNTCGRFPLVDANNNTIGIGYVVASLQPARVVIMTTSPQPVINAIQP
jgi:hypothetical protein